MKIMCRGCGKLLARASDDFAGAVAIRCKRCKTERVQPPLAPYSPVRMECRCGAWLATGQIEVGSLSVTCRRCRVVMVLTSDESHPHVQVSADPVDVVAAIEARWHAMKLDRARRSAIGVGLRFDIMRRDGFRCRYCGVSPDEGAVLEVDDVVPRAAGGTDHPTNLVTACWDCNRGKSDKGLTLSADAG